MAILKTKKRQQNPNDCWNQFIRFSSKKFFRLLLILILLALIPPIFFHFRLRRIQKLQAKKCGWIKNPPLVCAHGGDPTKAFPNTISAYHSALSSQVDCIEVDVSRSSDGILFALHDRDLQRISGNETAKVGFLTRKEVRVLLIKELGVKHLSHQEFHEQEMSTVEDALMLISKSVRHVILDAKVGPPKYEQGLAKDILSIVKRTQCQNCIIWAKSDTLARDIIRLSSDVTVGYIVMSDPVTGARTNLLRMKKAGVVGVYHPLVDDKLVRVLHGRNKKVYSWTVDEADSMRRMLIEQVDGVVTNHPAKLRRLMQDIQTQCLEDGFPLPR
ncbi:glycerophosphodiester phosphodiesterase GDPD4-like isoform X1 [Papaver somniferum]|uniref:glycerophosphodiester phosphodiesterase GDPD4-like isoform X1 n=1 Tax=Papaver somniferum TaxID=3469 RepID=UPI000E6F76CD|nr:glycerophosphodiester phosphodiesterase GDPD4-like isoform X1 [Papaver somniferum]